MSAKDKEIEENLLKNNSVVSIDKDVVKSVSDVDLIDTVHYLSPASTARTYNTNKTGTEYEGDFELDYRKIIHYPSHICDIRPSLSSESEVSCIEPNIQRTISIIKPDAIIYKDVILRAIYENGLDIICFRFIHLAPEQVAELYEQHYGSTAFPHLVVSMSVSPVLIMALGGYKAVHRWKKMVGPQGTLQENWFFPLPVRLRYGLLKAIPEVLHYSNDYETSVKENIYFFPENILEPIITEEMKVTDYCNLYINSILSKGLLELIKIKPIDPILFLGEWLLLNNTLRPQLPDEVALAPT